MSIKKLTTHNKLVGINIFLTMNIRSLQYRIMWSFYMKQVIKLTVAVEGKINSWFLFTGLVS